MFSGSKFRRLDPFAVGDYGMLNCSQPTNSIMILILFSLYAISNLLVMPGVVVVVVEILFFATVVIT